jgi:ATP-binding cassette subfamily B protein
MSRSSRSSRQRFAEYRNSIKQRRAGAKQGEERNSRAPGSGRPASSRTFWQLFWPFLLLLQNQRLSVLFALLTLTLATLLKLVPPAVTKLVIDYVLPGKPLPASVSSWLPLPAAGFPLLAAMAAMVTAVALLASLVHLWGRSAATVSTKRVQVSMRKQVFEHAMHLPLHRVYQLKSGGVASLLRDDAGGVAELIFSMIYNPWRAIIQLLGSLAVLAWVDWRLLLGSLIIIPAVFVSHRTWISRIRPLHREIRQQRQEVDSYATEAFGGMRVVRAFGRSRAETGRFTRGGHLIARQELLVWRWSRFLEIAWDVFLPLASAALLLYGGAEVLAGRLSTGDLMMFMVYLAMLLEPLTVLAESAMQFQNNLAGWDRILDLLGEPREMPSAADARVLDPAHVAGAITLRNVSFHYPESRELVLKDIELEVRPGEKVALVGASGAGKTTLCNLVARFYDPVAGSIEIDGVDLRKVEVESYRRLLGIVEQDIFLFDGSVADNIGYAVRHATQAEVERAARAANAHEFIMALPDGYDTIIGERGVRLSGGQRQRLAIARAVLADPRIFILDEATSNLDTESERLIQQSLKVLMRGRTSFVIAHRLSTILDADKIVVLAEGQIVETGTHRELLDRSGRYRAAVQMQMGPTAILTGTTDVAPLGQLR